MEVDEALGQLGIGRWQILHFTIISIACYTTPCFHTLAIIYIGAWPEHHCRVEERSPVNETIPVDKHGEYVKCEMYVDEERNKTEKCSEWEYIYTDIGPTVASQWDLVCDRAYLKDLTQTIYMVGMMVGSMICSALSDKFGRKPVFLISQWALVVVGVVTAFAPNYLVFVILRFFPGLLTAGIMMPGYVMTCELFAAKHRTFAGIISVNIWAVTMCLYALLAYLIANWVYLQLFISLLGLLTIPLYWILRESVVWLCAENRVAEAEEIIRKAAKLNNITMPDKILAQSDTAEMQDSAEASKAQRGKLLDKFRNLKNFGRSKKIRDGKARYTLVDIFRNRHLTVNLFCMIFLWMVVSLVYYGLTLAAGQLAGNFYLNNFISGLVEIVGYTSAYFCSKKFGRRNPLIAYYVVASVSLILSQVIPEHTGDGVSLVPMRITLSMVAKYASCAIFIIVYLYTPEIFPTTIRSQSIGVMSFAARVSSLLAPFTSLAAVELPWLPGLLFGGLSTAAGLLTLLLPETLNRPLPQTIDDIEQFYKRPVNQHEMIAINNQPINSHVDA